MTINETYKFLGLFAVSIVANYFLPHAMSQFFFWGLLFLFAISKNNKIYLWLVFFWLLFTSPGYLFYNNGIYKLPSINISGMDREIYYHEVFAIISVLKAVSHPEKQQRIFYYMPLLFIISYAVFLLLFGFLSGASVLTALKSIRFFIPLLLLLFIPRLLPYNKVPNAIKLMFVCVFILLFAQLFDIIMGRPLASTLGETQLMAMGSEVDRYFSAFDISQGVVRTIYGPFILLISIIISLVLLQSKNTLFKSNYLILVISLASLSILLSATRGWILAVVFIFASYVIIIDARKFLKVVTIGCALMVLVLSIPNINMQITGALERIFTVESLLRGDFSDPTFDRITERGPRVMSKFYESPVFGFGFSDEYYDYQDGHAGNQTLLLNGGIVGYGVFLFFFIFLLSKYFMRYKASHVKEALIFLCGLFGLFIIHSSSRIVFGYAMDVETAIALAMFFFVSDYFYKLSYIDIK